MILGTNKATYLKTESLKLTYRYRYSRFLQSPLKSFVSLSFAAAERLYSSNF